jgi:hypothetical protein
MTFRALGRLAAPGLLLAAGACGGRVEVQNAATPAVGGQSAGIGGRPEGAPTLTTVGGSTGASSSPGSSAGGPEPLCNGGVCPSVVCTDGAPVIPAGQCCPVCPRSPNGGGPVPPPSEKCLEAGLPPLPCPTSPADLACKFDSDCTALVAPVSCGATCEQFVYSMNTVSTASCEPCPPDPACNGQFEYLGQDCRLLLTGQGAFSARCVGGECVSYAIP